MTAVFTVKPPKEGKTFSITDKGKKTDYMVLSADNTYVHGEMVWRVRVLPMKGKRRG